MSTVGPEVPPVSLAEFLLDSIGTRTSILRPGKRTTRYMSRAGRGGLSARANTNHAPLPFLPFTTYTSWRALGGELSSVLHYWETVRWSFLESCCWRVVEASMLRIAGLMHQCSTFDWELQRDMLLWSKNQVKSMIKMASTPLISRGSLTFLCLLIFCVSSGKRQTKILNLYLNGMSKKFGRFSFFPHSCILFGLN